MSTSEIHRSAHRSGGRKGFVVDWIASLFCDLPVARPRPSFLRVAAKF